MLLILFLKIIICINGCRCRCLDVLHQWLSIPEYLHKMFKSMHMQVIVIEINAFLQRFLTSPVFVGTVKEYVSIIMCCYVRYILKYALKSAVKH